MIFYVVGMPVILTQEKEAVLLGAAILAATAAGEEVSITLFVVILILVPLY